MTLGIQIRFKFSSVERSRDLVKFAPNSKDLDFALPRKKAIGGKHQYSQIA